MSVLQTESGTPLTTESGTVLQTESAPIEVSPLSSLDFTLIGQQIILTLTEAGLAGAIGLGTSSPLVARVDALVLSPGNCEYLVTAVSAGDALLTAWDANGQSIEIPVTVNLT